MSVQVLQKELVDEAALVYANREMGLPQARRIRGLFHEYSRLFWTSGRIHPKKKLTLI
jgi:hypothetical protein